MENSEFCRRALPCGAALLEGEQLLGGACCLPALLNLLAAAAGRKENLVFIVWLFLISFCFRDPLLRENNVLKEAQAPAQLRGRQRPKEYNGWADGV